MVSVSKKRIIVCICWIYYILLVRTFIGPRIPYLNPSGQDAFLGFIFTYLLKMLLMCITVHIKGSSVIFPYMHSNVH
jgi:hypothetical protein